MKEEQIQEIMACLPGGRTKFYYFKDRYALMLLDYVGGKGLPIRKIKQSSFGKLIQKPLLEQIIKHAGSGKITPHLLGSLWPAQYQCYLLTLGKWGDGDRWYRRFNQTSRPGWNLVLQLNFSGAHNHPYHRMVKPKEDHPFKYHGHPIAKADQHTLAWARIDLDLDAGEALIEEIQNDWIRMALESKEVVAEYERIENKQGRYVPRYVRRMDCNAGTLGRYIEEILKPHMRLWAEAMLCAAIWFLKEEIGIDRIFYHTFDFGCRLKGIDHSKPPRSLYTQLPERFCFTKVSEVPIFLQQHNDRRTRKLLQKDKPSFYLLNFANEL